ncbi:Na+/H+ antiporter NhaC family protein [Sinanaerobacter sp. ZZT-01]|uniref:Na+/H+ antiporter NhaC family protein n=1 Tax=Sinanaerobacter sp. ZZT-01 TaxID=3111540 RepID=UPI002D7810E3|nr:Na+/H+ antiporter NhaC family protein [Sinanaerobacter sp. ZZT-01]WRR94590.1 Na+/H+ antiporter NhaC family protein [Sinanaerobacter sp. ZZT-01]
MEMESSFGIISLLPPAIVIILALKTKKTLLPLMIGTFIGVTIICGWNPFEAIPVLIRDFIATPLTSKGNINTLLIMCGAGGFIRMLKVTGAGQAFAKVATRGIKTKKGAQLATCAAAIGFIYTEPGFVLGVVMRPITEALKVARVKLAYIIDSLGCNVASMSPICSYGPYIVGLITAQLVELGLEDSVDPWGIYIKYLPYNFYGILAIITVVFVIAMNKPIGGMYLAELRADKTGQIIAPTDNPIYKDAEDENFCDNEDLKLSNFLIPMGTLFVTLFGVIFYTGDIVSNGLTGAFLNASISLAIMTAMYMGALAGIVVGVKEKMFTFNQGVDKWISGVVQIMEVNMVVIFAWALSGVANAMGLKFFIAGLVESTGFSAQLIPAVVFVAGAVISFATGSSWGTWALLLPIAVPVCYQFGIGIEIAVAATVGGGLFGDHCSPISDTTIKCSMATASDHLQHVGTQFPFALIVGCSSCIGFLVSAFTQNLILSFGVGIVCCLGAVTIMNKVAAKKYANYDFSNELAELAAKEVKIG